MQPSPVPGERDDDVRTEVPAIFDALRRHQLLSADQLREVARGRFNDPRNLGKELLRRGWLTPFQVNQLLLGRAHELVFGPYLVLERLGEGGTGQVYKARHRELGRVVALKVIRKELVADAEVMARFHREIRVASRLDHVNVVRAFDAGSTGSTHYLAMELVTGTDLAKLVKQSGPIPVEQACEYIRQAALGLQHAHEQGMVHRDVKPSNLLLDSKDNTVKVVDLGLARLERSIDSDVTMALGRVSGASMVTPVGAVMMGTPDYLAPEQAIDFHAANIRADIYSLGCTFYYLLTGQPPFPGDMLAPKLLKHQHAEPTPVRSFRADVSEKVISTLARMTAKNPDDRYQAPGEVAQALESVLTPGISSVAPSGPRQVLRGAWQQLRSLPLRATAGALLILVVVSVIYLNLGGSASTNPSGNKTEETKVRDVLPASPPVYLAGLTEHRLVMEVPPSAKGQFKSANGEVILKGILLHPHRYNGGNAGVGYRLDRKYRFFKAAVALAWSDSGKPLAPLVFAVKGDDKFLWRSSPMQLRTDRQEVTLDISGIDKFELWLLFPRTDAIHAKGLWIDPEVRE